MNTFNSENRLSAEKDMADPSLIVRIGYGRAEAYPCTIESAKKLLNSFEPEKYLPKELLSLTQRKTSEVYLVEAVLVGRAYAEILKAAVGEESPAALRLVHGKRRKDEDGEKAGVASEQQSLPVSQALKDQAALWCVNNGVNPLEPSLCGLNAALLNDKDAVQNAPLMDGVRRRANGRAVLFADTDMLDAAIEYEQLSSGAWKPQASVERVVERYLQFARKWLMHRDDHVHIAKFQAFPE